MRAGLSLGRFTARARFWPATPDAALPFEDGAGMGEARGVGSIEGGSEGREA